MGNISEESRIDAPVVSRRCEIRHNGRNTTSFTKGDFFYNHRHAISMFGALMGQFVEQHLLQIIQRLFLRRSLCFFSAMLV